MSPLLTVEEAARMLACTPAAVRKWLYQRRLPCVKVGRLVRLRFEDIQRVVTEGLPEPGTASQPPRRAARRLQRPPSRPAKGAMAMPSSSRPSWRRQRTTLEIRCRMW